MTQKELTEFVEEAILVVKKKLSEGYLTEREYRHYVLLFRFATDRILHQHSQLREEVRRMTEPLIKLSTKEEDEFWDRIEKQKAQIANQKSELEAQKTQLANKDAQLAEQEAEIRRLQQLVDQLSSENHAL